MIKEKFKQKKAKEQKLINCVHAKPKIAQELGIENIRTNPSKRAQEEIVGFAVIMILVVVILLILLGIYIKKPNTSNIESYQLEHFVSVLPEINTDCDEKGYTSITLQKLISKCYDREKCLSGEDSCEVLKKTIKDIMDVSWPVGEEWPNKGYIIAINESGTGILEMSKGIQTGSYKHYSGVFGDNSKIDLKIYE